MAPTPKRPSRGNDLRATRSNLAQEIKACEDKMRASLRNMQARLDRCQTISDENQEDIELMIGKIKHRVLGRIANMKNRLATLESINSTTRRKCEEHSDVILEALMEVHGLHGSISNWKQREEGRQAATSNVGNEFQDQSESEHQEFVFVQCSKCNTMILEGEQQDHVCHSRRHWPKGKF